MAALGSDIVLFGGSNAGVYDSDTWQWDGTSWTALAATGPGAREFAAMAPVPGGVLMFGGFSGTSLGDTWLWNGVQWTQRNVAGPSARSGTTLVALP
jgi:hypothetical protein